MAHEFRKLDTNSAFPNIDNVEVYKYDNDFDYSRYDYTQMDLQICSVPWDMGEAHIGNRTISGIGNVVYFGSKEKRDAWFDAIPDSQCFRFSTKFKELHREQIIDVPIPYDVCARFNYLKVHYALFANDESPVMFEDDDGLRDWFWFIREVEFVAPNTTRLHLMDDAFQTWIYDVDITGMVLERGHAPMFEVNADEYLSDPLDNNELLLTEDVNFGEISQVKHIDALALNAGTMYACVATSANPNLNWGSKADDDWNTPASESYTANGNPSFYVFAVPATQLATLLYNITQLCPQFKQTVQGVFFASADLVTLGSPFTFADTTCYNVSSTRHTLEFIQLEKSQFGYPARYADLAKLYTSPYAHIEITDENGNVDIVRIEDTTGTLDVSAALSLAYPFVTIDAHILGAGGDASATVTFRNVSAHTFDVSGQWYETLRTWNVPTFAVVLDAATEYDYSTHFDRIQRENDYDKAYANTSASALTAKTNRDASATTTRDNAYRSADTAKANADLSATTARDNAYASADTAKTNAHASADTVKANADLSATTARDNAYASADTARDNAHAMADTVKANADASALVAKDNAYDSAATAKANVATIAAANKANTDDSADAAKTNVATIATANKSNADASATTAKTNVATIAAANKANADDNADTLVDNATLNTAANTATTTRSNQSASTDSTNAQSFNTAITTADNIIVSFSATSTIAANEQQGAISAGASMANGIIGAAGSAASLDPIGAVSSIASGIVGGATTIASTAVANGLTAAQAGYTQAGNNAHETASNHKTNLDTTNHNNTATDLTATQNTLITGTTANSATTTKGNATRTQTAENTAATATETTTKANALRTQTAENTAATLTQTTTKANATRTQTAENAAAAATEKTTKANADRTYNTATGNNADMQTTTKANATRTRTTDRANALKTYNTAITNNAATNTTAKDNATRDNTTAKGNALNTYNTAITNNAATNTAERANALNTYDTATASNLRDYNTAMANAARDKANAQADIDNDILQAALRSPFVYGEFANGESSANKPIALFANIVTQSKGAISAAGDEFLRYGYTLDKFWEFDGNWNIGKYFTYWKLRDFWVSNLNVPDMYMDRLRFFLFGGVTIWRRPEDIGKKTIYENFA